mmetsp:Transcript_29458/g.53439  ORF Transcript_29458/g.53439 Transcript_29458/m.53439 type:complete len:263 (-) Transcript_29458:545-1333(-)
MVQRYEPLERNDTNHHDHGNSEGSRHNKCRAWSGSSGRGGIVNRFTSCIGHIHRDILHIRHCIGTINVLAFHISVKHSIAGINSRSRIGPDVGHDRLSHGVIVIDHLCPRNGCSLHTISGIVLAIGRVEPLRRTIIGHALICHPKLESRKSKMRMTILAGVLTGVDVRTEITPDIACISHILSAIVRTTAVPIVTSRRFASIFKLEVGVAGRAINQDWTLELDGVSFIVTEVFEHKFIERVLFDAATTRVKVKPVVAHLVRA